MLTARTIRRYCILAVCTFTLTGNLGAQKVLESLVTYFYLPSGDSVRGIKVQEEYNGAGKITTHSIYSWNRNTRQWEGYYFPCEECMSNPGRSEYRYDERGNRIESSSFVWRGNQLGWLPSGRSESIYDEHSRKVSVLSSLWDVQGNIWIPDFSQEYGYSDKGQLISTLSNRWDGSRSSWLHFENRFFEFDSVGRKTLDLRQTWVNSSGNWVNQMKTEWYFDSVGIITEIADFNWTLSNNNYVWKENGRHKIENVFDSAGNMIQTTDFQKISATDWRPVNQEKREYNESGKPVLSVISKGTGTLTEYLRSEWLYGSEGLLLQETMTGHMARMRWGFEIKDERKVIRSFDREGDVRNEIWYLFDFLTQSYLFDSKDYYFYLNATSSEAPAQSAPISLYPNPTNGIISLTGLTQPAVVKIYSMQGMLLRSVQDVEVSVDISDLSPGAYLVLVTGAGQPPFRSVVIRNN
jgi:hypothetical protein